MLDHQKLTREVTKAEFFVAMGPLDVHPHPRGAYPYRSDWELRDRRLVGQSFDGSDGTTRYFLPESR